MIRRISFAILFASSTLVFAQPLYKWVEADGSITFSPKKPPEGINYETVNKADKPTLISSSSLEKVSPAAAKSVEPRAVLVRSRQTAQSDDANPTTTEQSRSQSADLNASNNKQRRCQDLKKRVVSLERRLKSRLTPEDMDNTVVHMARYQRSFDQHCVQ